MLFHKISSSRRNGSPRVNIAYIRTNTLNYTIAGFSPRRTFPASPWGNPPIFTAQHLVLEIINSLGVHLHSELGSSNFNK